MDSSSDISSVCQNRRLNSYVNASCLTRFWFLERIANCHRKESISGLLKNSICRLLKKISKARRAKNRRA